MASQDTLMDGVQERIAAWDGMKLPALWAEYEWIVGERSSSPNKTYLIRRMRAVLCGAEAAATAPEVVDPAHVPVDTESVDTEPVATATEPEPTTPAPEPTAPEPSPAIPQLEVEQSPPPPWSRKHVAKKRSTKAAAKAAATAIDAPIEEPAHQTQPAPRAFPKPAQPLPPQIDPPVEPLPAETRLSKLPVSELRARYLEVVGRPTGSTVASYLIWKIREVQKGHIQAGPRAVVVHGVENPRDSKVLPLRVGAEETEAMDAVWRARGFASRMEFLRESIARHLAHLGAEDVAKMFSASE